MSSVSLTKHQYETLCAIKGSEKPVTLQSNTRTHNLLIKRGLLEVYRIPVNGVPACYSTIIPYVRLTPSAKLLTNEDSGP